MNPSESIPDSADMDKPFPFLQLLPELRRMVYEYVPETVLYPVLSRQFSVYYEDAKAPTPLLLVNKLIQNETKAWFEIDTRFKMPVTIAVQLQGKAPGGFLRPNFAYTHEMLSSARKIALESKAANVVEPHSGTDSHVVTEPVAVFLENARSVGGDWSPPETFPSSRDEAKVREFLHLSLLRMDQVQPINFRYLMPAECLRRTKEREDRHPTFVPLSQNTRESEHEKKHLYDASVVLFPQTTEVGEHMIEAALWTDGFDFQSRRATSLREDSRLPLCAPTEQENELMDRWASETYRYYSVGDATS